MRVSLVNVQIPFVRGRAERLADSLAARIVARGHEVDLVRLPFKWSPPQAIADHMLACRLLNVNCGQADLTIALRFPAYLVPAKNKRLWLLHQFRPAYELWGTETSGMPDTVENRSLREMILQADNEHLREAQSIYTKSRTVAERLKQFNGIDATSVLYPPLDRPELFGLGEYGDYFFCPAPMTDANRQHVAVEAMSHVRSPIKLVLAGRPDSEDYGLRIDRSIATHGLKDKVIRLGSISEEEKAQWMNGALAAIDLSKDEDSDGDAMLEAFHAHKAVLSFTDSGEMSELIHNDNGRLTEPTSESLAAAMEELGANRSLARDLGNAAHRTLKQHRINWNDTLDTLLG